MVFKTNYRLGPKYFRMLQREHSAILSTFIKLPVVRPLFCLFLSGRFTQVLLYVCSFFSGKRGKGSIISVNINNCTGSGPCVLKKGSNAGIEVVFKAGIYSNLLQPFVF